MEGEAEGEGEGAGEGGDIGDEHYYPGDDYLTPEDIAKAAEHVGSVVDGPAHPPPPHHSHVPVMAADAVEPLDEAGAGGADGLLGKGMLA